jgi:hypothetical protein
MGFKTIVVLIAVVVLILFLAWAGSSIRTAQHTAVYPPIQNPCPDDWSYDGSGNCIINSQNKGDITNFATSKPETYGYDATNMLIDFTDPGWASGGVSAQCKQQAWAVAHGINWDTITNYNQC